MKSILIPLIVLITSVNAKGQNLQYNIAIQDQSLDQVLERLESKYGLLFSYIPEDIQSVKIHASIQTNSLSDALEQLFRNTGLDYELAGKSFILIRRINDISAEISSVKTFRFCGTVTDNASGTPLPFCNIYLINSEIGTSTDENGQFHLTIPASTADSIQISYIGYQTKKLSISDFEIAECKTIGLDYKSFEDLMVIIKDYITKGVILAENGNAAIINPGKTANLPGQVEPDVMANVQFLPGVTSPSPRASDIYIRGCTPDQTLLLWEGIPIYHAAHYFGMISAFNPYTINQIEVYRGSFDANYGGRIGGVVEMKSPGLGNTLTEKGIGANMTHAYAYTNQYIDQSERYTLSLSLRRSYSELIRTPSFNNITRINQQGLLLGNKELVTLPSTIEVKDKFNFRDGNIKFAAKLFDSDLLEVAGFMANNSFSDNITDFKKRENQLDEMKLSNSGFSARWNHFWTNKMSSSLLLASTSFNYDYNYQLNQNEIDRIREKLSGLKSNRIYDRQLHLSNNFQISRKVELNGGYQLMNYDVRNHIVEHSQRIGDFNSHGRTLSNIHSLYFEAKNPIANKIGFTLGVRAGYFESARLLSFEPRLSLAYRLTKEMSFHTYVGRHHQYISQLIEFRGNNNGINTALWTLANGSDLPVQQADLFQWGIILDKQGWMVDVEGYYRRIRGISSRAYEFEGIDPGEALTGISRTRGMDVLIKKSIKNFNTWISYSLSKTEMHFKKLSKYFFPSDYDQRHVLQISNQFKFNNFELALGMQHSTGVPYSQINNFEITSGPNEPLKYRAEYDGINNYYLSTLTELNLSVSHKLQLKNPHVMAHFSFSIRNILNRSNIFYRQYFVDAPRDKPAEINLLDKRMLPFTPNMNMRITW